MKWRGGEIENDSKYYFIWQSLSHLADGWDFTTLDEAEMAINNEYGEASIYLQQIFGDYINMAEIFEQM